MNETIPSPKDLARSLTVDTAYSLCDNALRGCVMDNGNFWQALDSLVSTCNVKIDRPRGTTHPRYPDFVYPLDYGYLEGSMSGDGSGIDVWIGSLPGRAVTGVICSLDLLKRDAEIKVLLGCTPGEARMLLAIHNDGDQAAILVERP